MIEIDGSLGEGGGQILRTALAFSLLTGRHIILRNIRAGRRNPGLAPQHLACVHAAAEIAGAEVQGASLRSTALTFRPGGPARPNRYTFDISQLAGQGSAGSVTLLLQTLLLPLALSDENSLLVLCGGTHVAWSPPVHYVQWVLLPTLARLGIYASMDLITWGWYPKGGGKVEVSIQGSSHLTGIDLTRRGVLTDLTGIAAVSNLPSHIPQRISDRANNLLFEAGLSASVTALRSSGPSTGAGLFLALEYEGSHAGFSALGAKGKPSEAVAAEAVETLVRFHQQGAVLDRYLPDQLLPVLALAQGRSVFSTVEITQHMLTNARVIQRFVDCEIAVDGELGGPGTIHSEGDGL